MRPFRDDEGVTTVGMAVSLALCLALLFSGAQLYRIESASAEIQEVADVSVLSAESEVAEFMIAVRTCDAVLLSMTLLAGTVYGIGIVAACVPPAAPISEQLISLGTKVSNARDKFAETASSGLNALQKMLPFLAAANAASVAAACNDGAMQASYFAVAVLLPEEGSEIDASLGSELSELSDEIEEGAQGIRDDAAAAEEAAKRASQAKQEAFEHDCGAAPNYCQYERAGRFPWMPETLNPCYASVDAWSFGVALQRAKDYYRMRRSRETAPTGSIADAASYHLRMLFYDYALGLLESEGYVRESDGSFEANFPKLFRNVNEFRETTLYAQAAFPVSADGVMHAYAGCPKAGGGGTATIADLESGAYRGCDRCGFSIESIGNIASASTNIANGFEHHYEKIRQAAIAYQEARSEMDPLVRKVKDRANPLLDAIGALLSEIGSKRIDAEPPGSSGAVCIVVNLAQNAADTGFESAFVSGGAVLGTRAAVSAAALVEDSSDDGSTVITSLLDGFGQDGGAAVGAGRIVLDCWSGLLKAYENGQAALSDALKRGLDCISVGTLSGLGTWAQSALESAVEAAGLQPANLNALKPAILNTGHVVDGESGSFAVRFREMKAQALSVSSPTGGLVAGLASGLPESVTQAVSDAKVTIAEIEFPVGDIVIPIEIGLPTSAAEAAGGFVGQCIAALEGAVASVSGVRPWE